MKRPVIETEEMLRLALEIHPVLMEDDWDKNKQYRDEWIDGYKAATKTYSKEDLGKAIEMAREKTYHHVLGEIDKYSQNEIIQSLEQSK
jgi:hypothetical protein